MSASEFEERISQAEQALIIAAALQLPTEAAVAALQSSAWMGQQPVQLLVQRWQQLCALTDQHPAWRERGWAPAQLGQALQLGVCA